jgi:hypothetical protein
MMASSLFTRWPERALRLRVVGYQLFEDDDAKGPKARSAPADVIGNAVRVTLWSIEDIAELVEASAPKPETRGTYKKRSA